MEKEKINNVQWINDSEHLDEVPTYREFPNAKHLCGNCENATAKLCIKVRDRVKKTLGEYDFIEAGDQTFNADGSVNTFLVTCCKNFKRIGIREITTSNRRNLRKTKESMKIAYFDVESIDEADALQEHLIENGTITNISLDDLSSAQIRRMNLRKKQN